MRRLFLVCLAWLALLGATPALDPAIEKWRLGQESDEREVYRHRHEITKQVGLRPGMSVADIGSGSGLFSRLFAREVGPAGRVYAVDISKTALERMQVIAKAEKVVNITPVL